MTYYITYGVLFAARFFGQSSPQLRSFLYVFLLILLWVFSGFRFEVGCDWHGYENNWGAQELSSLSAALTSRDPAHWTLIHFLQQLNLPYTYLNAVTSALFFFGLHILARRQPDPLAFLVLAFPVLIVNMPMSAIRQAVAIGFCCVAFTALLDRSIFRFVASVVIGSLFHASILIFLFLVPFVRSNFSKKNIAIAAVLSAPGLALLSTSQSAELASARYVGTGVDAAGAVFRMGMLALTGLMFVMFLSKRWRFLFPRDYKLANIGAWMMIGVIGLYFLSSVIGDRVGYYLVPLQLMIFARLPYLNLGKNSQIIVAAPYIGLTAMFLVWTQASSLFKLCYLPYQLSF